MISLLGILFLVASCGEPVPPEPTPEVPTINFSDSGLTVSPEGGEASMRVTATGTWVVETDGQDWYKLTSASTVYAGESILKVSASPNNTSSARTGIIRFINNATIKQLTVSQAFFVFTREDHDIPAQQHYYLTGGYPQSFIRTSGLLQELVSVQQDLCPERFAG